MFQPSCQAVRQPLPARILQMVLPSSNLRQGLTPQPRLDLLLILQLSPPYLFSCSSPLLSMGVSLRLQVYSKISDLLTYRSHYGLADLLCVSWCDDNQIRLQACTYPCLPVRLLPHTPSVSSPHRRCL